MHEGGEEEEGRGARGGGGGEGGGGEGGWGRGRIGRRGGEGGGEGEGGKGQLSIMHLCGCDVILPTILVAHSYGYEFLVLSFNMPTDV